MLCIGDSLTAGSASADWVTDLAAAAPTWKVVNAGTNGQVTLICISLHINTYHMRTYIIACLLLHWLTGAFLCVRVPACGCRRPRLAQKWSMLAPQPGEHELSVR